MGSIAEKETETVNEIRIRELMTRWQVWRDERRRETLAGLGYGKTMIGKCLDDMPTTKCNLCRGRNENCERCSGTGIVQMDPTGKICPAFIASTHCTPDDEMSERIDRIMCALRAKQKTLGYYLILLQEYTRVGTQKIKSERIRLSWGAYKTKLSRAHRCVYDSIFGQK